MFHLQFRSTFSDERLNAFVSNSLHPSGNCLIVISAEQVLGSFDFILPENRSRLQIWHRLASGTLRNLEPLTVDDVAPADAVRQKPLPPRKSKSTSPIPKSATAPGIITRLKIQMTGNQSPDKLRPARKCIGLISQATPIPNIRLSFGRNFQTRDRCVGFPAAGQIVFRFAAVEIVFTQDQPMTVATKKVEGRRTVRYESFRDLLNDAEKLSAMKVQTLGNWSLGQILKHIAVTLDASIDGAGFQLPSPVRWLLRLMMKRRYLTKPLPAGFNSPASFVPAETSTQDGLDLLRAAIERQSRDTKRVMHPAFGMMTNEEWEEFNLRHAEMHMSFVVPFSEL